MATDTNLPTFSSRITGTLVQVAGGSSSKLIFSGLIHTVVALILLACGSTVAYIGLTEKQTALIGLAVPFILVGLLLAATGVRRFRAVSDHRIYIRAGPGGVVIGVPTNKFSNIVRLDYPFVVYEWAWKDIRTWYPRVTRINGIPTDRSLVFEGTKGWRLSVPLLYFAGSQSRVTDDLNRAINRT